ncbi:hypothetical protein HPB52_014485 [Rhipicephalus sanguineus]|uniref:CCHC-type domain-containing protein n=1 Tax=Rhipicephalus sanguineus TaxID=34632 RepID=A0A9D4PN98_RHISA|nr:hypothetical protein HPB52_014485 [Rhipicephalus sanguineus]
MEIVEGEEISQDEACSPGWMTAYGRKNSKGMRTASTTSERDPTPGGRKDGGRTAAPRNAYQRIVATSRLPQLPRDTYRIMVRQRDGLNVTKVSQIRFEQALAMAAALAPAEIEEDTICPNGTQNIYVVCTPHEKNACAYVKAQQVGLGECTYRVSVYPAPPDDTCKGVIKGVDVDISEDQLRARIVNHRNPGAIEVKRIKNTTAVVVLFKGMKVPNYVSCGASMFRCTLYRRHTEVCYGCGGLGHRADVCPNPNSKWCRTCGQKSPTEDHNCTPKCSLCGGPHPTADRACKKIFQVPYIVRRRRRQRHRRSEKTQMARGMQSRDSSVSSSASSAPRRGRSVTPTAQRRNAMQSRSRSRGRSASKRRFQEELTWADRVKKTPKPKKVARSASPQHGEKSEIEQLRQEIASLKAELRKQKAAQGISSRVEGANVADNTVHKSTQEPKVEVSKAKRKAPPPKEYESDSEMPGVESSQNKMLEELLRISKENQSSNNQLALRMGALESKVGAIENKGSDRDLPADGFRDVYKNLVQVLGVR